ncbi:hypothetical protein NQL38_002554 [Providencia rettgeri]|uniref:Uncharacterized protein n=1 Tax=Moellerella wisconsensis ATCC 35017 TaxID=1354267 RepID=A0A0N1KI33_9GAMM|nr:hypothetical protein M992_2482 [Moellerella wisconsensis ATCC 35017]VFS54140.1 Uncharacterised protein [Moellerella wisconsensis]
MTFYDEVGMYDREKPVFVRDYFRTKQGKLEFVSNHYRSFPNR